jgi:hypothetical protein
MVSAFEGNRAETKTMLPVIEAFMTAHRLLDVTGGRGRGHDLRDKPQGDRGSRAVVSSWAWARPRAILLEFRYRVV